MGYWALIGVLGLLSDSHACPSTTVEIGDKCVHLECVVYDHRGVISECGNLGYCSEKPVNRWGCVCLSYAVNVGSTCVPKTCVKPEANVACSMNGICIKDRCICNIGHSGNYCEDTISTHCPSGLVATEGYCVVPKCQGDNGLICGGHGECLNEPRYRYPCTCDEGYNIYESTCYPAACLGDFTDANESLVCGGHGTCTISPDASGWSCNCDKGYVRVGNICAPAACVNSSVSGVCGSHGICTADSNSKTHSCLCNHGYVGTYCEFCAEDAIPIWSGMCLAKNCANYDNDGNLLVCNGLGGCNEDPHLPAPTCKCSEDAFLLDGNCYPSYCRTGWKQICSGNGECTYSGCECYEGFGGFLCEYEIKTCPKGQTFLDGKCYPSECVLKDNTVCSYFGTCVTDKATGKSRCVCPDNLLQASDGACVPMSCIFNGKVCPGMGPCQKVSRDAYECYCNFLTSKIVNGQCVPYKYLTKNKFNEYIICSGRGRYDEETDSCVCHRLYRGAACEFCASTSIELNGECYPASCINVRHNGQIAICGNYGQCVLRETGSDGEETYSCQCNSFIDDVNLCVSNVCKPYSSSPVCSGHGYCDGGACVCDVGYQGVQCEY